MNTNLRFLRKEDFSEIHKTFLEAYSDYIVKFQLTEAQLENHIAQNAVQLEKSVGVFADNRMVGITLNGFGTWNGKETIYDAGTGVVPNFRRKGAGQAMFDFMIPKFREIGINQMLLEVISENKNALRLYQKIGFEETRRLIYFEQKEELHIEARKNATIRLLENPDWQFLKTFHEDKTSWQNSIESVARTLTPKMVFGAFRAEKLVGYGIVFQNSGIISQLIIHQDYRNMYIASDILAEIRKRIGTSLKLRFSNVDESLQDLVGFLGRNGFGEQLSQIEMVKTL